MIEWFSKKNLQKVLRTVKRDQTAISSAITETFEEVYNNMDTLDAKIEGISCGEKDLSIAFADEIANYSDVWEWLHNRIAAVNYNGINVGDYIIYNGDSSLGNITCQIAGIDTYYNAGMSDKVGHHIDFISKELVSYSAWGYSNNNGSNTKKAPYMTSNVRANMVENMGCLVHTTYISQYVVNKLMLLEERYSSSKLLDSTGSDWYDMGYFWLPTEYEIFGSIIYGTKPYSVGMGIQYPLFAGTCKNNIKLTTGGVNENWWLATVRSGKVDEACAVLFDGRPTSMLISDTAYIPLCFRIG